MLYTINVFYDIWLIITGKYAVKYPILLLKKYKFVPNKAPAAAAENCCNRECVESMFREVFIPHTRIAIELRNESNLEYENEIYSTVMEMKCSPPTSAQAKPVYAMPRLQKLITQCDILKWKMKLCSFGVHFLGKFYEYLVVWMGSYFI